MTHFHDLCHGNYGLMYIEEILELRKLHFWALKSQFDVKKAHFRGLFVKICNISLFDFCSSPITHFHDLCHLNCSLRYIEEILELRKLHFVGLKLHVDIDKAHFKGLLAKIGYMSPILASTTHLYDPFS